MPYNFPYHNPLHAHVCHNDTIICCFFLTELLRKPIERLQSYSLVLTVSCINIIIIFIINVY